MQRRIRQISFAVAALGLLVIVRSLPVESGIGALTLWVEGRGILGPIAFGAAYLVAALLFVPGSVLTLAAGAVFGLWTGTAIVSLASTSAAALSFLISRHLARKRVEEMAASYPMFGAIDRAIAQAGWRMIALLRLSPVMPFSLGNYLFGLTAVPFWPYALSSWVAMLPGTFMYVYLGHIGTLALAGGASSGGTGRTVLTVVGLIATVVVTIFVSRLAGRAIKEHTNAAGQTEVTLREARPRAEPKLLSTLAVVLTAVTLLSAGVWARGHKAEISGLFGPPPADLDETYADQPAGAVFDHRPFDDLLTRHVDSAGLVDYSGLAAEAARLDSYLEGLATGEFDALGRDEKLAFLINAYNAFTLRLILDHRPLTSIRDIPASERWDAERWTLAGGTVSLNQIEHELVRPNFVEPRVHFALVCAAIGCPPLRSEAYTGADLERQLAEQSDYVHTHARWFRYEQGAREIGLTALYDWYGGDFEQVAGSVHDFAARYSPTLRADLQAGGPPAINWLDYDWRLNTAESALRGGNGSSVGD